MGASVCVFAGVLVGTAIGASRRGSGLGRVGRVWACVGVQFSVFSLSFFVSSFPFLFFFSFFFRFLACLTFCF